MTSLTNTKEAPPKQTHKTETPMMRQYNEIKAEYQDSILFHCTDAS